MKLKKNLSALLMPSFATFFWALCVCFFWPIDWQAICLIALAGLILQLLVWFIRPRVLSITSMPVMFGTCVAFIYTSVPREVEDDGAFLLFCGGFAIATIIMFLTAILIDAEKKQI